MRDPEFSRNANELAEELGKAFSWGSTPQGYDFWANVQTELKKVSEYFDSGITSLTPRTIQIIPGPVIVHAMDGSLPYCRFTTKAPKDWPKGHERIVDLNTTHVTCINCKKVIFDKAVQLKGTTP